MKLELKHLAPYLPYSLIFQHTIIDKTLEMIGIENRPNLRVRLTDGLYVCERETLKPILRPISDLDKEISFFGGIPFIPINRINMNCYRWILVNDFSEIKIETYNFLIEHHFDIFGLIPAGLAVSIHDVGQVVA